MGLLVSSLLKILSLRIEDVSHGTIVNVHSSGQFHYWDNEGQGNMIPFQGEDFYRGVFHFEVKEGKVIIR